jgi:hypothetical protein
MMQAPGALTHQLIILCTEHKGHLMTNMFNSEHAKKNTSTQMCYIHHGHLMHSLTKNLSQHHLGSHIYIHSYVVFMYF